MRLPYRMLVLLVPLLLTACTAAQPDAETETTAPTETIVTTEPLTTGLPEPETEPPAAEQTAEYTGEPHIFDECGVLDSAALTHYNEYLENLGNSRLIHTAAVITGRLNGEKPEVYAKKYYQNLYGTESGFLLLINNDTGQDVLYREGVCSTYITDTALPLAQATPHLVEGDYAGAFDILLPLGENVPEFVFDKSGSLRPEQIQALVETAQARPERNAVLLTDTVPQPSEEETAEEALAAYAEDIRSRLDAKTLLVMDTQGKRCVIAGAPPELLASEVQTVWTAQGLYAALTAYYDGLG